MKLLNISGSPHVHSDESTKRIMWRVNMALIPALIVATLYFGVNALLVTLVSVVSCVLFQWLIEKFIMKVPTTIGDGSAVVTGLLLAFNVPATASMLWIVVIGALVAIGIGKMAFGGLGKNPFNPALVGRVFLLISFPVQMTTWPLAKGFETSYLDAETGATPLYYLKQIMKTADGSLLDKLVPLKDALLGAMGGSLGEVCALALIIGGLFLICTRVITWHIPVSIIATVALFAWIATPSCMEPHTFIAYQLLSGGLMLGAFFMATDYVTSPMTAWGKIIFGVGIGFIMMVIRTWGAYPEGMSFAILIMNACVPLLNKIRPQRFGEPKKA